MYGKSIHYLAYLSNDNMISHIYFCFSLILQLPLCQAYITDVSEPQKLAGNLGTFQGLSAVSPWLL